MLRQHGESAKEEEEAVLDYDGEVRDGGGGGLGGGEGFDGGPG